MTAEPSSTPASPGLDRHPNLLNLEQDLGPTCVRVAAGDDIVVVPYDVNTERPCIGDAPLFEKLQREVQQLSGQFITQAVLTVNRIDPDCRQFLQDAAKFAGIQVEWIISEPRAAASAFGLLDRSSEERSAIYAALHDCPPQALNFLAYNLDDTGFTAAVVSVEGGITDILATHHSQIIGGTALVENVLDWIVGSYHHWWISFDMARLRELVDQATQDLFTDSSVEIQLDSASVHALDFCLTVTLTRDRFVSINQGLLNQTVKVAKTLLHQADIRGDSHLDQILLLGHWTSLPVFPSLLDPLLRVNPFPSDRQVILGPIPDAIVKGAALEAKSWIKSKNSNKDDDMMNPVSITQFHIGIELADGLVGVVTPRHAIYPASRTKQFTIHTRTISLFRGYSRYTNSTELLGSLTLPESSVSNNLRVAVTLDMDDYENLNVTVVELDDQARALFTISTFIPHQPPSPILSFLTDSEIDGQISEMVDFKQRQQDIKRVDLEAYLTKAILEFHPDPAALNGNREMWLALQRTALWMRGLAPWTTEEQFDEASEELKRFVNERRFGSGTSIKIKV
ncbi:Hsp70 protein-domain-containing protein [Mycena floridula]|nr:Hsp70 protein-domain-containing protein [Mycena floridula]